MRALGLPPGKKARGLCMRSSRGTAEGKARDPRALRGGGGRVKGEGKSDSGIESLRQLGGSGVLLGTGILSERWSCWS